MAMLLGIIMPSVADATTPDSVFVVKNGRIFSAYEVGKDVDNITFNKSTAADKNTIIVGDKKYDMKSALLMQQGGLVYAFFSPDEGLTTMQDFAGSSAYLQVAMSPDLLGEDVTFSKFATEWADCQFSITFCDMVRYNEEDDYEPLSFASDDWNDYFAEGTLRLEQEGDKLTLTLGTTPGDGGEAFGAQYEGAYTYKQPNPYYFTVDGDQSEMRAVFAQKVADGVAFYLTSGNIDNANDLENCHYYARLFVPNSEMDGTDIDVKGKREYELYLVDNVSDLEHSQMFSIASGMAGNASGYVSVLDRGDGSYTLIADVENMGLGDTRDLQFYYKGTPMVYDLSKPSQYALGEGEPVSLKSAVYTCDDDTEIYTIYLSSKENVTTLEGMADADVVITVPEDFYNDDNTHGFSGTDTNAKLSITYGGDKFSQANTGSAAGAIATGGNVKATINAGQGNIDFTVFGINKYDGSSLKGHFEGSVTRVNK